MEESAGSYGAADALRQEDLVVFCGDGGHHDTEDVQDCAPEDDVARTVVIKQYTYEWALWVVESCVSAIPVDGGSVRVVEKRTPKNIMNVINEVTHVIELVDRLLN